MIKLKDIRVVIMTLCIAVLMILTINTVVYGAETETNNTNVGLDSFDGMLSAVKELKDNKPQWFHRNINISEAQQKFQVVCVYDVCDECTVVYPVVFAVDGSKLDAKLTVKMKTDDSTGYSTLVNQNLTETFNVPNRWRKSTSGNLWGTYIPIYNNSHYSDKEKYRIISSMPLLKYDRSLGSADYGNTVQYAMDTYEKGWNNNPNYTPTLQNELPALEEIGYLQNVEFHTNYIGGTDQEDTFYYISYDSVTNTGFDITRNDVKVSLYTSPRIMYSESLGDYLKNKPTVEYGDKQFDKSVGGKDCRVEFDLMELRNKFDLSEAQKKAFWGTPIVLKLQYWLRVEYSTSEGLKVGGWVKIADDDNTVAETNKRTQTIRPDGTIDDKGGYPENVKTPDKVGKGDTQDKAIDNEKEAFPETNIDLNWFLEQLKGLKVSLGEFPQLVSSVFGWLPSPVITLIGIGITIMIVVSLIRAVRG